MQIQEIREQIINQLQSDVDIWNNILSETNPGNYGVNDWEVEINESKLYVDIPNKEFSFRENSFSANLVMGASKGDSSFDMSFNKMFKGTGTFDFENSNSVKISNVEIEIDKNVFID